MKKYTVALDVNCGEYSVYLHITCKDIKQINSNTLIADGIEIEYEENISRIECD